MRMNKTELINEVAVKSELSKKDSGVVVNAIIDTITETLADGEKVSIQNFGNFETRERAARKGRNPQSGEEIDIPAKTAPAFKASKALKESVK